MDLMKKQILQDGGIDVDEAMARFVQNEALMMKFLLRFSQDKNFALLKQAMENRDAAAGYTAAHTLKGVVGNLSMKALFDQASAVTEDLRRGDLDSAMEKMPELENQYQRVLRTLESL